jgi:entericidin B
MKFRQLTTIALLVGALTAVGCANTIRGAGKDVANTANATEGAVKNVANAAQ